MTYAEIGQVVAGASGLLLLAFAGYGAANLRYRVPGTGFFVALAVAGAIWSFGYAYEKGQTVVEGFLWAARIEYLGVSYIPTLWLLVSLSWMGHPLARSWWFRGLVLLMSTALFLLVSTNDLHYLWYQSIVPTGRTGFARYHPGPLYYFIFGLFLSTLLFSTIMLFLRKTLVVHFRQKATIIFIANLFPVAFSLAFQLGIRPGGLDLTVFSLIPAFSTVAWGLFHHDFIRVVPIAREAVVESLEDAVLVYDGEGRLVDHNPAAGPLVGQLDPLTLIQTNPRGDLELTVAGAKRLFRIRRSDVMTKSGAIQGTALILTDITEENRLLEELAHQASHDALTGLANRRHFEDHARGELIRAARHGSNVSLVLFDLDWFKSINDRFGHPSGDQVLRAVAEVLTPRLRPYDLLARLGGEEFAVLMPETGLDEAREAAERWRIALESTPQVLPGAVLPVTASFGVAALDQLPRDHSPDVQLRLDSLMGLADKALYRAKTAGRNRVC